MTSAATRIVRRSSMFLAPALFASLLGCGYKGPLYLPPPPDTIAGQGTVVPDEQANIPAQSQNPSLEPAPIVIE